MGGGRFGSERSHNMAEGAEMARPGGGEGRGLETYQRRVVVVGIGGGEKILGETCSQDWGKSYVKQDNTYRDRECSGRKKINEDGGRAYPTRPDRDGAATAAAEGVASSGPAAVAAGSRSCIPSASEGTTAAGHAGGTAHDGTQSGDGVRQGTAWAQGTATAACSGGSSGGQGPAGARSWAQSGGPGKDADGEMHRSASQEGELATQPGPWPAPQPHDGPIPSSLHPLQTSRQPRARDGPHCASYSSSRACRPWRRRRRDDGQTNG